MNIWAKQVLVLGVGALVVPSCSTVRPQEGERHCVSWKQEIGPLLTDRCGSCHGGDTPAGGYDLTRYQGVLAVGADNTPNAIAGDADSQLLAKLAPGTDEVHAAFADTYSELQQWVVSCRLSYVDSPIHQGGILNPDDPEQFHGVLLRNVKYDFSVCGKCHGADLSGGAAGVACKSCHPKGPTDCSTCHGEPTNGAHVKHREGGDLEKTFACSECHVVPETLFDPGHVLLADGSLDPPPADITFGALARRGGAEPSYDPASGTCSDVYCHGGTLGDAAASNTTPNWRGGAGEATCGSCHGTPPANHGNGSCATCHTETFADGALVTSTHLDGEVEVVDTSGCTSCHGYPPPPALSAETDPTFVEGAHAAHLSPTFGLRGPLGCDACHVVPTDVWSPGHLDSDLPAEVFPPGFSGLATSDGAQPSWDRSTGTCSNVYCHGNGAGLAGDGSTSLHRTPNWLGDSSEASCGTCHGVPPQDGNHAAGLNLGDCATCHPSTVDSWGMIIVNGSGANATSTHINGVADAL